MTNTQCPNCKSPILADDRFCENCGVPLIAEGLSPTTTCLKCGANDIDAEGYCAQCGFRNAPISDIASNERIKLVVSQRLAGVSDPGLKRDRNEDYLALQSLNDRHHVLVVCDGVSSSQAPEVAAKMAANTSCQYLVEAIPVGEDSELAMKKAIASALKAVCAIPYQSQREEDHDPPSTTIVAASVQGTEVTIGWLGDSRAYWISGANIQQLTEDDSWLNDVVKSGKLSEIEARQSPQAHAISRWLGKDAENDAVPSVVKFTISSSGYLLLCSDGLWNYIHTPSHLAELVQRYTDPNAIVLSEGLVEFARSQGGADNITVAILSI
ncbi:protein phosphatase 2C domain-containing protein [Phormidium sp. LEGE 05292]|uniref:PP2C family serine/threonine-protein phosphatase n=1 Tax=[Phormidium] sp. LEGE 05292 TaxID=767427 RepID=UPI0018826BAC|nr:protein phosphatase 2C domain-containing protein [Phormidium sp. LEGE 05292]MBE9228835.1 protein phosphatase 2C domain-containing protein [Phormidium sp. LEGE 05292]